MGLTCLFEKPLPAVESQAEAPPSNKAGHAFIVFSAATMSSPTSFFGHTMLVLSENAPPELLSTAVEYTAIINQPSYVSLLWNGLSGGFQGIYQRLPYWEKVKDYQELEMRDIWAYELDLTTDEITRLERIAQALDGTNSAYAFLNGNCATRLLPFIEAARPGLSLPQSSSWVTAPADVIRTLHRAGLIRQVYARPSLATRIRLAACIMSPEAQALAYAIGRLEADPVQVAVPADPVMARSAYDVGLDYLRARRNIGLLDYGSYQRQAALILTQRAWVTKGLDQPSDPGSTPDGFTQVPTSPVDGHGMTRLTLGMGSSNGHLFEDLTARIAFHGLDDPAAGYDPSSQVTIGLVEVRWDNEAQRLQLQRIIALDMQSLTPSDRWFQSPAWRFGVAGERVHQDASGQTTFHTAIDAGYGLSWRFPGDACVYALADAEARWAPSRHQFAGGVGPVAGVSIPCQRYAQLQSAFRDCSDFGAIHGQDRSWNTSLTISPGRDFSLGFRLLSAKQWGIPVHEQIIFAAWYW